MIVNPVFHFRDLHEGDSVVVVAVYDPTIQIVELGTEVLRQLDHAVSQAQVHGT